MLSNVPSVKHKMSIIDNVEEVSNESNRTKRTAMRFFQLLCNMLAFSLTCWCFHKYWQDKDVSHVNYRRFHDGDDSLYPSVTLCFNNPFLGERLREIGDGINITTYVEFLEGKRWDERMAGIDYDNVTVELEDYLVFSEITLINGSKSSHHKYYVSMRSPPMKCFSFDMPFTFNTGVEFFIRTAKNSTPVLKVKGMSNEKHFMGGERILT